MFTMRLSDFILLNEEEKKQTVLHEGVLIAKRKHSESLIFLFHLGNFYVETFCNTGNKAIEEYRVFDTTKPLFPYLDAIRIDELLN